MNIEMDNILFDSGSGVIKFVPKQKPNSNAMKKILLTMALVSLCCTAAWAQFGNCTPSEMQRYADTQTDHAHPSFSPDGTKVLFQSGHFSNGKRLNLMMVDISDLE